MLNKSSWIQDEASPSADLPELRTEDLAAALRLGWRDFVAFPTSALMIAIIYPLVGLLLARVLDGMSFLPLLFPLAAGFALLGPFAAILFYVISQRQRGDIRGSLEPIFRSWKAVMTLGAGLGLIFVVWLAVGKSIYNSSFGFAPVASMADFAWTVVGTAKGQLFLFEMLAAGLPFAAAAFVISVIAFPMILERGCSASDAVVMSFRVILRNPAVMLVWALSISILLAVAMLPAFIGLAVVLPVLGHASWHLYKRATR